VQHQEVQQRLQVRARAGQALAEREFRPCLRVGIAGQEAAGAAVEGVVADAAGREPPRTGRTPGRPAA
jgi:hypothetical protein